MKAVQYLRKLTKPFYIIGYLPYRDNFQSAVDFSKVQWIKFPKYKKNWVADPFLFSISGNTIEILVEEMREDEGKGRLSKLCIDKKTGKLLDKKVILDLPSHLSFPIFFKENEKTYVYPENSGGGALRIYEYDYSTDKLVNPQVIIDEPLVDTIIHKIDGTYYAFGVVDDGVSHESTKILKVYSSKTLTGKYTQIQTIKNDKKWERGAGHIIERNGRIFRPAQSCEERYGHHIVFFEMVFDGKEFKEKYVGDIMPGKEYPLSIHTYNELDGYVIIDSLGYYYGRFSQFLVNTNSVLLRCLKIIRK